VNAALIEATRPGRRAGEILTVALEAYAVAGHADEWQQHHQGGLAGFLGREYRAMPRSTQTVEAGQLFAWNPSVKGAKCEETILVGAQCNEVLTHTGDWPVGPNGCSEILRR